MHCSVVSSQQNPSIRTLRSRSDVRVWSKKTGAGTMMRSALRVTQVGECLFIGGANSSGEATLRRDCRAGQLNTSHAGCKQFKLPKSWRLRKFVVEPEANGNGGAAWKCRRNWLRVKRWVFSTEATSARSRFFRNFHNVARVKWAN